MRSAAVLATGILVTVGLVSACGGGRSSHSNAAISSPTGRGAQGTGLLGYSSCMRSHGVPNFPDPSASGGIDKQGVVSALTAVSQSVADAAQTSCAPLLPAGGSLSGQASQPVTAQDQQYYLKAVACMRQHGITNFPDPTFSDGNVSLNIPSSIDTSSAQFTQAAQTCTKLIPSGLPYSHGSGG